MRVAVFIKKTHFHQGYGGIETQNKVLVEGLAGSGHEVYVFSPKLELTANEIKDPNVTYVFLECTTRKLMSNTNSNSWLNKSLTAFKKTHAESKFDIVLSQSSAGIAVIMQKNELDVKVISIAHGSIIGEFRSFYFNHHAPKDFFQILLNVQYILRQFFGDQRKYLLNSNKVIAVSSAVKTQLEDETFPPEGLIEVIHNGVDPIILDAASKSVNFKSLVYVGQLTKDKGCDFLLLLQNDIRFKDFTLTVIGDGELIGEFKSASTTQDVLGAKINYLGKLPHADTLTKLSELFGSIFVFPTRRVEGFPMVLVEAMMAGLPVVAYDIGGVRDAVSDGDTGYLVRFNNKKEFMTKVLKIAADPLLQNKMAVTAVKIANASFTREKMITNYIKLITEVLKK